MMPACGSVEYGLHDASQLAEAEVTVDNEFSSNLGGSAEEGESEVDDMPRLS
jgi:hypothetical protein